LKRILCNCCCLPCRQALHSFQNKYTKTEKYSMAFAGLCLLLAVGFLCAYVRARESIPLSGKNVSLFSSILAICAQGICVPAVVV
jgi:hypothetical protein